jgi:hypothetical protein
VGGEFGGDVQLKVQRIMQDTQRWADRAEQTRLQAEEMTNPSLRCQLLQIAAGYRRLAQHANQWASRKRDRALSD